MKRFLDTQELKVLFFTAYFVLGRSKYGSAERGDIRLGRIAACRGVMALCRALGETPPLSVKMLEDGFDGLEHAADRLHEGAFKTAYLETLEAFKLPGTPSKTP